MMQIKIFSIRLHDNTTEIDQNSLNDFLETVDFKKSSVQFVDVEPPFWSVVVHFEEKLADEKSTTSTLKNVLLKIDQKSTSNLNVQDEEL